MCQRGEPAKRAVPSRSPPARLPEPAGSAARRRAPNRSGTSASRKRASSYTPAPRNPIKVPRSARGEEVATARRLGGCLSRTENPRSIRRLTPTRAMARIRLSITIPPRIAGENRQSRGLTTCQQRSTTVKIRGGNHWSVSPSVPSADRIHASAPVLSVAGEEPMCQMTPIS